MLTLGIDLATREGKTGLCRVKWGRSATVEEPEVRNFSDEELFDRMSAVQKEGGWIGIDAPFGFPLAFTKALSKWHGKDRAPPAEHLTRDESCCRRCGEIGWDNMIRRETDVAVHRRLSKLKEPRGVSWPLSAVVERITPTTVRCAQLLSMMTTNSVDRVGSDESKIVEVYPKAALSIWGMAVTGYKDPKDAESRRLLVRKLQTELGGAPLSDRFEKSDDCIDALVAACVARAVACGKTDVPPQMSKECRSEGWIHLPKAEEQLGDLVKARTRKWG